MTQIQSNSFRPPLHSRSPRRINAKSNASGRGVLCAKLPSWDHSRKIVVESMLELKVLYLLLARPDLDDIREQFPKVRYTDSLGRTKHHVFDFLITLNNQQRIAIAVKPAAIVERRGFRDELTLIASGTRLSAADAVVLITDRSFSAADVRNAEKLHEFKRTPDLEADAVVLDLLSQLTAQITIAELVKQSKLDGRGFRAVFRAIFTGAAKQLDKGDITYSTLIRKGEQQ